MSQFNYYPNKIMVRWINKLGLSWANLRGVHTKGGTDHFLYCLQFYMYIFENQFCIEIVRSFEYHKLYKENNFILYS